MNDHRKFTQVLQSSQLEETKEVPEEQENTIPSERDNNNDGFGDIMKLNRVKFTRSATIKLTKNDKK